MSSILSVQGLKTYFTTEAGVIHAVDDLSYDLKAGETLAIVGESGCGKSVHALSILRLLPEPPAKIIAGKILFHGKDLLRMPADEMRKIRGDRIAMIFQEPMSSLNPVINIGEQITEAVRLHLKLPEKAARARTVEMLSKVGIPHASERIFDYPHQFSGGMRQRVMIAMALSCNPEVLIADEPTTALDVTIQAQILELMKSLQQEFHMAIILITHNLGIVAEIADDVLVMYAGQGIEKAPTGRLFSDLKHPYTWGLLNSVPKISRQQQTLESIEGQPPVVLDPSPGCRFQERCRFRMEICGRDPENFSPSADHTVACWLHGPRASGQALELAKKYEIV
ncbi:MAG: ABC transporter ATP-binding protein [Elusimicrobia bacterium]|nr:ABC transporter ATP-binding protein [Elusimicrobiota bacterium]